MWPFVVHWLKISASGLIAKYEVRTAVGCSKTGTFLPSLQEFINTLKLPLAKVALREVVQVKPNKHNLNWTTTLTAARSHCGPNGNEEVLRFILRYITVLHYVSDYIYFTPVSNKHR
jgi:hypothetical protein